MDFSVARHNMVENQVRTNRVTDARVLDALEAVPREAFVPEVFKSVAYLDGDIDVGGGRRMLEPMVFARLLQNAAIQPHEVVLDIACGTGYSAAVLSKLASTVVALESDKALAARATALLAEQGDDNVAVVEGPLSAGDKAHGPYDVIIIEGSVAEVPDALAAQLADRGRLLAITKKSGSVGVASLTLRVGDTFSTRQLFDASGTMLSDFARKPGFVF
ncbi:MAG TPA: protein-L-isoaspartate O-methyltransferase [Magnetospirillaceae bacterium]|jgi:protein-L-isoaspartate(D-aspartate) O-methyltransferase